MKAQRSATCYTTGERVRVLWCRVKLLSGCCFSVFVREVELPLFSWEDSLNYCEVLLIKWENVFVSVIKALAGSAMWQSSCVWSSCCKVLTSQQASRLGTSLKSLLFSLWNNKASILAESRSQSSIVKHNEHLEGSVRPFNKEALFVYFRLAVPLALLATWGGGQEEDERRPTLNMSHNNSKRMFDSCLLAGVFCFYLSASPELAEVLPEDLQSPLQKVLDGIALLHLAKHT